MPVEVQGLEQVAVSNLLATAGALLGPGSLRGLRLDRHCHFAGKNTEKKKKAYEISITKYIKFDLSICSC